MNIDDINGKSLVNIHFDEINNPLNPDDLSFMNIVFAGDGQFFALNNEFGTAFDRFDGIKYRNLTLQKYDFDWSFELKIKKAPRKIFEEIVECFKYVLGKIDNELLVIIYYDTITKKHIMDIVKMQIVSGGSINYAYNQEYEMSDRYIKFLEIHSHNTMAASFSGTDNIDESNRTLYYCGVIGRINQNSTIFDVDQKFRIWTGISFREVEVTDVFEDMIIPVKEILPENKSTLDQILNISKIVMERRSYQTPANQSQFPGNQPRIPGVFTPNDLNELDDEELDNLYIDWDEEGKGMVDNMVSNKRGLNANKQFPQN